MLVAINDNGKVEAITAQTREPEFREWMGQLAPSDFDRICGALNEHIEDEGFGEIAPSRWTPGTDWAGTPYGPIYDAVGRDSEAARRFFGLILWNVLLRRPETWSFGRYPRDSGPAGGRTYYRVHWTPRG